MSDLAATHTASDPDSKSWTRWVFVIGFLVFTLAGLRRDLWAPDEPRHAAVANEMLRTGEFVVPHLNGEVYPDKPPPPFWLMTVPMRYFGETNEWAARLPFALAAGLVIALTFALARRFFDRSIALTAALLLATAAQFIWLGQRVSLDILQTLFVLAAIFAWVREQRGEGSTTANGFLFFAACGAGLSTKGPTALLIPLAAALGHAHATGTLRKFASPKFLVWILLMLAIVAAWLVPAGREAGEDYVRAILGSRSFGRFSNAINHDQPFWYYLIEWPTEFLPWAPGFIVALLLLARRRLGDDPNGRPYRLIAWWIGIPFLVLSIAQTKRGNYLLPLYPAAAILTAVALHHLDRLTDSREEIVLHALMRGLTMLIALAGVAACIVPFTSILGEHHLPGLKIVGPCVGLLVAGIGVLATVRGRESLVTLHRTLACGLLALVPVAGLVVFPVIDCEKSDRLIAEKLLEVTAGGSQKPIAFLRYSPESSRFYSGLDCREIRDRDELAICLLAGEFDFAVVEAEKWDKLRGDLPASTTAVPVGEGRARDVLVVAMNR